jgi:hypothetical protein
MGDSTLIGSGPLPGFGPSFVESARTVGLDARYDPRNSGASVQLIVFLLDLADNGGFDAEFVLMGAGIWDTVFGYTHVPEYGRLVGDCLETVLASGAQPVWFSTIPVADSNQDLLLRTLDDQARGVCDRTGTPFLDLRLFIEEVLGGPAALADGVHLTAEASEIVGAWLADQVAALDEIRPASS